VAQLRFPAMDGGANRPSLIEAQANFRRYGAAEARFVGNTRPPLPEERRDSGWRPFDPSADPLDDFSSNAEYPASPSDLYYWRPGAWRAQRPSES
jgi:hypothetical protein